MSHSPLRSGRHPDTRSPGAALTGPTLAPEPEPAGPSPLSRLVAARPAPVLPRDSDRRSARAAGSRPRPRPRPAAASEDAGFPSLARIVTLAVVVAFLIGAVWLDRDNHEPVAGFGLIATPGAVEGPVRAPEAGEPAPNFRLRTSEGGVVELALLRGEVVVLHVWTTWCFECRAELEALQALTGREGVTVLGIVAGERASRVKAAVDDFGITYSQLLDLDQEVSQAYGAWSYPATIVIDPDGVIRAVMQGPMSPDPLEDAINAALGGG